LKKIGSEAGTPIIPHRPESEFAIDQLSLRESLLREFRQFDTLSATSLIADIAAHWGGLVAKRDRHDDPRVVAEKARDHVPDMKEPSPLPRRSVRSSSGWWVQGRRPMTSLFSWLRSMLDGRPLQSLDSPGVNCCALWLMWLGSWVAPYWPRRPSWRRSRAGASGTGDRPGPS